MAGRARFGDLEGAVGQMELRGLLLIETSLRPSSASTECIPTPAVPAPTVSGSATFQRQCGTSVPSSAGSTLFLFCPGWQERATAEEGFPSEAGHADQPGQGGDVCADVVPRAGRVQVRDIPLCVPNILVPVPAGRWRPEWQSGRRG